MNKILEQLLAKRIVDFLQTNGILYSFQYGFRAGSSTLTAACELVEDITEALDTGKRMGVLFLDLKKAFDTIDHQILLQKLEYYGIRGISNQLLGSYLSGRTQYVEINGAKSTLCDLTVGVPQGSNLGPLLFLIYINDIAKLKLHGKPRLFADDTSLSYPGRNTDDIKSQMSEDMELLQEYFAENLLSLNLSKTRFMMFRTSRSVPAVNSPLLVNSTEILQEASFKYLGLTLDSSLTWKHHIKAVSSNLSSFCGFLWKTSKFLPRKQLLTLYHAFAQSKLQYLISIWGAADKTKLKSLQLIQNRCIKTIYKKPRLYSTINLYNEADGSVLPVAALRKLQCVTQMHNLLHNRNAHHNQRFDFPTHRYDTRGRANLALRRPNTELMKKSFSYYAKVGYNALPASIKTERNLRKFKKAVRVNIRENLRSYIL